MHNYMVIVVVAVVVVVVVVVVRIASLVDFNCTARMWKKTRGGGVLP